MIAFIVTTIVCFITYLLLTTGSGTVGLWSMEEILFGVILSLIAGFVTGRIFVKEDFRMLNHVRRLTFIAYAIARAVHKSDIEPVGAVVDSLRKMSTKKTVKRKTEVKE